MSSFGVLLLLVVYSASTNAHLFQHIPGGLKHVTGSANYLWGVNNQDQIYQCNRPCSGNWIQVPGGLMQVDANDDEVWGVASDYTIWKRPIDGSGSWQNFPGRLKHVSASGYGYIWGVDSLDKIWKCKKPCSGAWSIVDGSLKQIDGGYKYVYGVSHTNEIWVRPVDGSGSWRKIPGSLSYITASGYDEVFGVNSADKVYRCKKPCVGELELIDERMKQCDATNNGLFGVNDHNNVFRYNLP